MKNACDRYAGFTLIEILVVMTIMALFLAMMPRLFTDHDAQMRFDETRCSAHLGIQEDFKDLDGMAGALC
jgi:prepilin-type N-terminal cleavage/methylation domain-containing protein